MPIIIRCSINICNFYLNFIIKNNFYQFRVYSQIDLKNQMILIIKFIIFKNAVFSEPRKAIKRK